MKKKSKKVPVISEKNTLFVVSTTEIGLTNCKIKFDPTKMFYEAATKSSSICLNAEECIILYKILRKHFKKKKDDK